MIMHLTAFQNAARFRNVYAASQIDTLVEIGAQVIPGQQTLRSLFGNATRYINVDFQGACDVDLVLDDVCHLPLPDDSANVVISSSFLEHSEYFWLTFLEMCRICRSPGLIYLNVPADGVFHKSPVDCWRFYPDSSNALQKWARRSGYALTLLESYISNKEKDSFSDTISIFCKGSDASHYFPHRITDFFKEASHVVRSDQLILPSG